MDQKDWEERLDRAADSVSRVVTDGVRVLEDEYERAKEKFDSRRSAQPGATVTSDATPASGVAPESKAAAKGSPRMGLMLVGLGLVWLLNSLGILDQPVFPILLIVLGVYFIARSK